MIAKKKVYGFSLEPTKSFSEGPPQREEYEDDVYHEIACRQYQHEWREEYHCVECHRGDCPQNFTTPTQ
jgi:hypothetical protein